MIVRLKYNEEKPNNPGLTIERKINMYDSKSDIVCMSEDEYDKEPEDICSESDTIPAEILSFMDKWRNAAEGYAKKVTYDNFWPVKDAETVVYYKGRKYLIDPGILYGIGFCEIKGWMFENIENMIERDMYSIGADYCEYFGMLD